MSLLFYVGKRRGNKTFAGAKVQQKNDICKSVHHFYTIFLLSVFSRSSLGGEHTKKRQPLWITAFKSICYSD